jgi:hypothetical protein
LDVAAQTESLSARLAKVASGYRMNHLQDVPKAAARRMNRLWQT